MDDDYNTIVQLSYNHCEFTISSRLNNDICVFSKNVDEIKTIVNEHVQFHMSGNKNIRLESNCLPGQYEYTSDDKNIKDLNLRLFTCLHIMVTPGLRIMAKNV